MPKTIRTSLTGHDVIATSIDPALLGISRHFLALPSILLDTPKAQYTTGTRHFSEPHTASQYYSESATGGVVL